MSTLSTSIKSGEGQLDPSRPESPVLRLLRITDQGLVFESRRRFEVGAFIDLGVHVPGKKMRGDKSSFLNLEGFLVDCQPLLLNGRLEGSYRVTVLFSDLDAEDRNLLRELAATLMAAPPASPMAAMSRSEMMLQRLEEVFGLN